MTSGVDVGDVGEAHAEAGIGHGIQDAIQCVLTQQVALGEPVSLAMCDQFEPVLTREWSTIDVVRRQVEADGRKAAGLEAEDASCAQLHGETAGIAPDTELQRAGMVLALCPAITRQGMEVGLQSQGEWFMIEE